MKVLFIAPLPPPVTGHSVAAQELLDRLRERHDVDVVDLSIASTHVGGVTAKRSLEVVRVLGAVARGQDSADVVYLTIAQSLAGNIKDLLIYALCRQRLSSVVIHLHGGSIGRLLFEVRPAVRYFNARFIHRLGAIIVSGRAHERIFRGMADAERVHIVPNFAGEELFLERAAIAAKFDAEGPVRVLYLSGMTEDKGYRHLADAWMAMDEAQRARIQLDFAGRFNSAEEQAAFETRIAGQPGVRYHGLVDGATKRRLFSEAHVFCLPTTMLEGQPISILEAYAAGCAVITTAKPGIRDIFTDCKNGFEVPDRATEPLSQLLSELASRRDRLRTIAMVNAETGARCFRPRTFTAAVETVLSRVARVEPAPADTR